MFFGGAPRWLCAGLVLLSCIANAKANINVGVEGAHLLLVMVVVVVAVGPDLISCDSDRVRLPFWSQTNMVDDHDRQTE